MEVVDVEDRLVKRYRAYPGGPLISRGKRVGKDCPLTRQEIRTYVDKGIIYAVKLIKESRNISLTEAKGLIDAARYGKDHPLYIENQRRLAHLQTLPLKPELIVAWMYEWRASPSQPWNQGELTYHKPIHAVPDGPNMRWVPLVRLNPEK